jgi:hypothetical protein
MLVVVMGQWGLRGARIPSAFRQKPSPIVTTSGERQWRVVIADFRRRTFPVFVLVKHVTFMP